MRKAWMFAASLALIAGAGQAHQEPIDSEWCEGGRIVLLGKFSLQGNQLERFGRYVEENGECPSIAGIGTRTCGQFDDEYGLTRTAADHLCGQFKYRRNRGDAGSVKPIFYEPASFRDQDPNHHELYRLEQGVVFACGLCKMPREDRAKQVEIRR